ncbi:MaoC family dehydratase [Pilimelia terevasa]|uniref:MaoC family dehydratase n=1 Tax=Pilimelia terevasa TaxID=53372 RepID=A0A8J3BGZ7_9ACTN|nr:MaoC/PaaZ C-terminal domain-containing protein [Pilimelia terevasa]GGK13526.1 MaoC family dehydratase [Pilimelia terevasa]
MEHLPTRTFRVTRADLVRYAGAAGDFNPIHWSDRVAASVGLPGVIAHGMLTMALAGRAVTAWVGRADAVAEYGVRFARPVVVPDDPEGAVLTVDGVRRPADAAGLTRVDLTVSCAGEKVLAQARALVRWPVETGDQG